MRKLPTTATRNEHKRALFTTAGTANQAIAVDTRPRAIKARKGAGSYTRRERHRSDFQSL